MSSRHEILAQKDKRDSVSISSFGCVSIWVIYITLKCYDSIFIISLVLPIVATEITMILKSVGLAYFFEFLYSILR